MENLWLTGSSFSKSKKPLQGSGFARRQGMPSRLFQRNLGRLDVVDGNLAGTTVFRSVEGKLLAFAEAAYAGALESGGVDEHVLAAIVRLDEAEAFLIVVELNGAR